MTRDEAITAAGRSLAASLQRLSAMTPRQVAEQAHRPGGPSVDEIERRIRARRAGHPLAA